MVRSSASRLRVAVIGFASLGSLFAGCAGQKTDDKTAVNASTTGPTVIYPPGKELIFPSSSRGLEAPSKLPPALQRVADASETSRGLDPSDAGAADLPSPDEVGYPAPGTTDVFLVAIHIKHDADLKAITVAGAHVQTRLGDILYATVHARDLAQVSEVNGVERVAPMPRTSSPAPPKAPLQTTPNSQGTRDVEIGTGDAAKFDHSGLTGKGVIVGVIDTGIDWRHADFLKPDGVSTRVLYLWDMFDDSWANSNHTVGSKPPFDSDDGKPLGTLYTSDQINAAIKGQLQIARTDKIGHGTACAGTAAGNDLGVAPEADLIIVDSHKDDPDHEENAGYDAVQAAQWIKQLATQRHQPCVISMSFGGQGYAHDGTGDEQAGLNAVLDAGEARGLAICMSAGNEGADSIHARGHFGPAIPGEINGGIGSDVQLFETKPGLVVAMFDARDDWQLYVVGLDKFLFGTDQKPVQIVISKDPGNTTNGLHFQSSGSLSQSDKDTLNSMVRHKQFELGSLNGTDTLVFPLPPGAYVLVAGGNSEKVTHGVFDLYLPQISTGSFGKGGDHNFIVGGPGDADHVITVGSYDFRNVWENSQGTTTREEQINLGTISAYSSPGFRRDGVVKPDIAGPGQFTISAYAQGSTINEFGPAGLTKDGKHVAWAGTSASTPYTAGVVALMLEKNPQLTANQVVQILHDTADHDFAVTGAVPNPQWGYGKLNPEKAIQKVSPGTPIAPSPQPSPAPPSPVAPSPLAAFVGIFKGDGLVMQLVENADQSFSGSMQKGGQTFMLDAHVVASHLEGSVHNNGNDFPFSATVDGDNLMVHAGEKDFNLTRTAQPAVGAGAH